MSRSETFWVFAAFGVFALTTIAEKNWIALAATLAAMVVVGWVLLSQKRKRPE